MPASAQGSLMPVEKKDFYLVGLQLCRALYAEVPLFPSLTAFRKSEKTHILKLSF